MVCRRPYAFRLLLGIALLLVAPLPASAGSGCGLDILGVCKAAKGLAPVIEALPDRLRAAAEAVADHLFNVDLPPAIDKFTAAGKALEDRAEHDYEQALNATSRAIYDLAQKALALTEKLAANVTKDVEEVVQEVQKAISSDIDKLFDDINNSVNQMLHRLENDGKELFCAVENWATTFQDSLAAYFTAQDCECVQRMLELNPGVAQDCPCTSCFHVAGWYPKCSCKPLGLAFDSYHAKMKYDYLKCHQEKPINWQTWTVDQILSQLGTIQAAALGFRCFEDMNPGSTINRDYFSDEYTNLSYTIDVWRSTAASEHTKLRQQIGAPAAVKHTPPAEKHTPPAVAESSPAADSCAGKTIQQCVTEAMAQLQEAKQAFEQDQQEFMDAKSNLTAAQAKLATDIQANAQLIAALQNNVTVNNNSLTSSVSQLTTAISTNAAATAANKARLADLHFSGCVGPTEFFVCWRDCDSCDTGTLNVQTTACGGAYPVQRMTFTAVVAVACDTREPLGTFTPFAEIDQIHSNFSLGK